jgi:hypothetical protein
MLRAGVAGSLAGTVRPSHAPRSPMRILVAAVFACFVASPMMAQGLVNFANTPTTLVTAQAFQVNGPYSIMSGPPGSYYFGLFFGIPNNGSYTFTGIYATNTGVDGLFSGGTVAVPGWAAGTSQTYFVAGWSAFMGHSFNPMWFGGSVGDFGASINASGVAGNGSSIPTLNLFDGGGNTIMEGFELRNTLIPEPSTAALASLGAATLMIFCGSQKGKLPWAKRMKPNPAVAVDCAIPPLFHVQCAQRAATELRCWTERQRVGLAPGCQRH